jgi:hypothetical protein
MNACRSTLASPKATANRSTVEAYGATRAPRSRSAIPRRLSPARSANCSWVSPALVRYQRRSQPKLRVSLVGCMDLCRRGYGTRAHVDGAHAGGPAAESGSPKPVPQRADASPENLGREPVTARSSFIQACALWNQFQVGYRRRQLRRKLRIQQDEHHAGGRIGAIIPGVIGAALHHDIARL